MTPKPNQDSDTPETDALDWSSAIGDTLEQRRTQLARIYEVTSRLERQRNEAREQLASEKSTRNAIIAKGVEIDRQLAEARQAFAIATDQLVQVQSELRQVRDENARLREALANATCLILAVGEPKETEGYQHSWYESRKIVLEQVNKLTP